MTLDCTRCSDFDPNDDLKQARTKEFFRLIDDNAALDAELIQLVQENIYLEAIDKFLKSTPLMVAAASGRTDVIKALIAAGAKLEARDSVGRTALLKAVREGCVDVVNTLIDAKANLEAEDNLGMTPLMGAALNGHIDIMNSLIKAGVDLDRKAGKMSLMCAVLVYENPPTEKTKKTTKALLERGANVYSRGDNGNRPIDYIDSKTDFNDLKLLVDGWQKAYDDFAANGTAPKTKAEVYHLLAVMPPLDDRAPVNTIENIFKIMSYAKWPDMSVALEILSGLVKDCAIRPEDAADIQSSLIAKSPERLIKKNPSLGVVR